MQTHECELPAIEPAPVCGSPARLRWPFALAVFLGAFLLFQVQPLIGKFILPWYGGSPAVWTTCMMFFQIVLLAGYAYAHLSTRWLAPRTQASLHVILLIGALIALPIVPSLNWKPASADNPTLHILMLLTLCVGLPYFALSTTGPLLQAWFGRLNPGVSPYRLYALSNAGSLLALVSFPFVFEPLYTRQTLAGSWSWGLVLFALFCTICAAGLWSAKADFAAGKRGDGETENSPNLRLSGAPLRTPRWLWLLLPACASILLLATTNKLCQDVAVIPFFWILPLALYLLSFVLCFDSPRWYWRKGYAWALAPTLALLSYALFQGPDLPLWAQAGIFAGALFVCCMVCHGELYRLKPAAEHLTGYYLLIAAGGALGGIFVAVLAPLLFNAYLEFHWALGLLALVLTLVLAREQATVSFGPVDIPLWKLACAGTLALALLLGWQVRRASRNLAQITRNFYGVLRVFEYDQNTPRGHVYLLHCGDITHGLQFRDPEMAAWPTSYFNHESGVGMALLHLPRQELRRVGVVGLGIGTLATYGRVGDTFRFYEINPEVRRLAETQFTYLSNSSAKIEVVMGDARLSLERESPQSYDLLALDAFSGDAIPVHLLTREAFALYLQHLTPEGVLAVQVTNRHLDLLPILQNLAQHFGLHWRFIAYQGDKTRWWFYSNQWVLLTRNPDFLNQAAFQEASGKQAGTRSVPLWTDDYASLFRILK